MKAQLERNYAHARTHTHTHTLCPRGDAARSRVAARVWEMMRVARTHTPLAALSRPVAGISIGPDGWTTFIATLPGSPRAAVQAANALAPLLAPIVDVMRK